jgi:hypothetical protein
MKWASCCLAAIVLLLTCLPCGHEHPIAPATRSAQAVLASGDQAPVLPAECHNPFCMCGCHGGIVLNHQTVTLPTHFATAEPSVRIACPAAQPSTAPVLEHWQPPKI